MKRLGAVVLAVGMIVAALAWRSRGSGEAPRAGIDDQSGPVVVVCGSDNSAVCDSLRDRLDASRFTVRSVAPLDTVAALNSQEDPDWSYWVTSEIWVQSAISQPGSAERISAQSSVELGSSPTSLVMAKERSVPLAAHCGGVIDWACIFNNAGKNWADLGGNSAWGQLKLGVGPSSTSDGRLALAGFALAGLPAGADTTDLSVADSFRTQLSNASSSNKAAPDQLGRFLTTPAFASVILSSKAQFRVADAANSSKFVVSTPEPALLDRLMVVPRAGSAAAPPPSAELLKALSSVAADQGWEPGSATAADLPSAGLLDQLAQLWNTK